MQFISNSLKVASVLSLFLIVASCGSDDDTFEINTSNTRTFEDVIADFENIDFQTGVNDLSVESTFNNVFWNFRVIIPESASDLNKRPLVVRLHGAATIVNPDLHKTTECLVEPGFALLEPIILSPNSDGFIWYDLPNQEKVTLLTELMQTFLPVDEEKVVIMGYSDGANGAWYYAQHYPELYSAAIPLASAYNPIRPNVNTPVKIDIPMYVIHGSQDQLFPLSNTQGFVDTAVEAGTDLEFVVADGLDHFNSCDYVPYLQDAVTWLQNTVWD